MQSKGGTRFPDLIMQLTRLSAVYNTKPSFIIVHASAGGNLDVAHSYLWCGDWAIC